MLPAPSPTTRKGSRRGSPRVDRLRSALALRVGARHAGPEGDQAGQATGFQRGPPADRYTPSHLAVAPLMPSGEIRTGRDRLRLSLHERFESVGSVPYVGFGVVPIIHAGSSERQWSRRNAPLATPQCGRDDPLRRFRTLLPRPTCIPPARVPGSYTKLMKQLVGLRTVGSCPEQPVHGPTTNFPCRIVSRWTTKTGVSAQQGPQTVIPPPRSGPPRAAGTVIPTGQRMGRRRRR